MNSQYLTIKEGTPIEMINSPYSDFYNLDGLTKVFLTCDIDWAPEYAILQVLHEIERRNLKITVFATHYSKLLGNAPSFVEVGLHPDFTREHSTISNADRMRQLKEMYPSAVGMRSHRNYFGQNISALAAETNLLYDVSVLLWNLPYCQAFVDYNSIVRLNYMWEDGIHLNSNFPLDLSLVNLHTPGLKIFNVHPMLILLNSSTDAHRRKVTSQYKDLANAPYDEIAPEINCGRGIATLWTEFLDWLVLNNIHTPFMREVLKV